MLFREASSCAASMAAQESANVLYMNEASAKYSRWIVRAVEPRLVTYTIQARNEQVKASKLMCYLVSNNEAEYAHGHSAL